MPPATWKRPGKTSIRPSTAAFQQSRCAQRRTSGGRVQQGGRRSPQPGVGRAEGRRWFQRAAAGAAPIDEANDITFPVDPNIKAKAETEIKTTKSDLPLVLNDEVAMFINYFSSPKGKGMLERALARSGRYREMILATLKGVGVPQDLIYLAQAESDSSRWRFRARSARHVAVHGQPRLHVRPGARLVDRRTAGSGQVNPRGGGAPERPVQPVWRLVSGDGGLQFRAGHDSACGGRTGYADYWELTGAGCCRRRRAITFPSSWPSPSWSRTVAVRAGKRNVKPAPRWTR